MSLKGPWPQYEHRIINAFRFLAAVVVVVVVVVLSVFFFLNMVLGLQLVDVAALSRVPLSLLTGCDCVVLT